MVSYLAATPLVLPNNPTPGPALNSGCLNATKRLLGGFRGTRTLNSRSRAMNP